MQESTTQASVAEKFRGKPELVLLELPNGGVTGVAMREMRSSYHVTFAGNFVEPDEVEAGIQALRNLGQDDSFGSWKKDANIDAASLDEAIASSPECSVGQKFICLYSGNEWLWGIWNNPNHPRRSEALKHLAGVNLHSVADFHGTRVSAAKRASRSDLRAVRENQTLAGAYEVLEEAVALLRQSRRHSRDQQDGYETHPAVRRLCDWWNKEAPEGSREAGFARLYVWNEANRTFDACDPEEPATQAEQVSSFASYALFERPGMPTVLACYFRGRRFNVADDSGYTSIFAADGSEATSVGLECCEVDESYYALIGLKNLARHEIFSG